MEKIQKPDPQNQNRITEFGRLRFYCTKDTWIKSLRSPISKPDEHFGGLLLFEGTVGSQSFFWIYGIIKINRLNLKLYIR